MAISQADYHSCVPVGVQTGPASVAGVPPHPNRLHWRHCHLGANVYDLLTRISLTMDIREFRATCGHHMYCSVPLITGQFIIKSASLLLGLTCPVTARTLCPSTLVPKTFRPLLAPSVMEPYKNATLESLVCP